METEVYPDDNEPYIIVAEATYKVALIIRDRNKGSSVRVNHHRAGLEQLKKAVDSALEALDKITSMKSIRDQCHELHPEAQCDCCSHCRRNCPIYKELSSKTKGTQIP